MDRVMTWEEIEREYPDKWVLIADPEMDDALEILRGRVVLVSEDRREADLEACRPEWRDLAIIYTGDLPEGVGVIL